MATNLEPKEGRCTTPQQQASSFDDLPVRPAGRHSGEDGSMRLSVEPAIAQRRRMRDEALESWRQQVYQDGAFAERGLSRHMQRSLPVSLLARQTIPQWFLFAIHHRAADIAFRQVLRSVRRLGLKRVGDTKGFVLDHCGWYMTFCVLLGWLAARLGITTPNVEVTGAARLYRAASGGPQGYTFASLVW